MKENNFFGENVLSAMEDVNCQHLAAQLKMQYIQLVKHNLVKMQ